MPHKEYYRHNLPHFQLPGQWYFVTCVLQHAVPRFALSELQEQVKSAKCTCEMLQKSSQDSEEYLKAKRDYSTIKSRYFFQYDRLLAETLSSKLLLNSLLNLKIIEEAFMFWDSKKIFCHAWCVMPNHFHWVLSTFDKDETGKAVYLEDIMHSVKLFTARRININENLSGQLWTHESFETTIKNENHYRRVVNYTIMNPVKAGFVSDWKEWPGNFLRDNM